MNRYYTKVLASFIVLLFSVNCFGQSFTFNDLAFVCQTNATATAWTPASISTLDAWHDADHVTLDSTLKVVTNLTDLAGHGYVVTNSTSWIQVSNSWLNGHAVLKMNYNSNYLDCQWYTNMQEAEYWVVWGEWESPNLTTEFTFLDFVSGAGYKNSVKIALAGTNANLNAGTSFNSSGFGWNDMQSKYDNGTIWYRTNYQVLTGVFRGSTSEIYTNNVFMNQGNAGTYDVINGMRVGPHTPTPIVRYGYAWVCDFWFAKTNTVTDRTNMFWYITNKYASAKFML